MDILVHVAREGENLGSWPVDVVSALLRSDVLRRDDIYALEGSQEWKPLSELLPRQPLEPPRPVHYSEELDVRWGYFCRDGHTIEGPRRMDELNALMDCDYIKDEHRFFVVGDGKWHNVGQWIAERAAFSSLAKHPAKALSMAHPGFGMALKMGARLVDGFLADETKIASHVDRNPFTVAHRIKTGTLIAARVATPQELALDETVCFECSDCKTELIVSNPKGTMRIRCPSCGNVSVGEA